MGAARRLLSPWRRPLPPTPLAPQTAPLSKPNACPPPQTPPSPCQVFFYKRAQIFAADVYGAFGGRGLGAFTDAAALTCFADYRVPVVLRSMGVLVYSEALAGKARGGVPLRAYTPRGAR